MDKGGRPHSGSISGGDEDGGFGFFEDFPDEMLPELTPMYVKMESCEVCAEYVCRHVGIFPQDVPRPSCMYERGSLRNDGLGDGPTKLVSREHFFYFLRAHIDCYLSLYDINVYA